MTSNNSLKIIFLGTPAFAVPCLTALVEDGYTISAVVTQPDRPRGRGHKLVPSPIKAAAQELGLPVLQYENISKQGVEELTAVGADLMVTVAYGQILSQKVLDICPKGCINVHGSLLPKYRGAAPIEHAIIHGEAVTGISTMYTVRALDAGDVLVQNEIAIAPEDTGGSLRDKLAQLGAETLSQTLKQLMDGTLERTPQDEQLVTYAPSFPKNFGHVDFSLCTDKIVNLIRGANPMPGAYAYLDESKVKLLFAKNCDTDNIGKTPGTIIEASAKKGLIVATGDGAVEITTLQYPGGKAMAAKDFLRGKGQFIKPEMAFE